MTQNVNIVARSNAMTHRPCPQCRILNLAESHACARCGALFQRQTIVYSQDADAPFWLETDTPPAATDLNLSSVGRAVALTAATLTAEVALSYVERRFLGGRPVGSAHARRWRDGAVSALTGAAILLAEQTLAGWH